MADINDEHGDIVDGFELAATVSKPKAALSCSETKSAHMTPALTSLFVPLHRFAFERSRASDPAAIG